MRAASALEKTFASIIIVASFSFATMSVALPNDNQEDEYLIFNRELPREVEEFKVLRTDDKFEINRYVTKAWELKYADAYEILPHIKKVVDAEKGKARTLKYKDPQDGKTRYFVQVVAPEFQIPYLEGLIKILDLPGMESSEGDVKYNYRLLYRDAEEMANIIRNTSLSGEGDIFFDKKTNSVWIKDSGSDFRRDLNTLKFYDVPVPQVTLDVELIEVETDNNKKLGIYWDAWKNALGGKIDLSGYYLEGGETFGRIDALLSLDATVLADFINYIVEMGDARVMTKTKILVSNGQKGIISSLKKIPFQMYDSNSMRALKDITDTTNPGASSIDPSTVFGEKADGIHIEAVPNISLKSTTLDVEVTVNSLSGYTPLGMPIIMERRTTTNVVLKEGQKFALGVFDKETLLKQKQKVVLLARIPVIGKLFSNDRDIMRKSKIIVFITPSIKSIELTNANTLDGNKFGAEPILKPNPADFADTTIGQE